MIASDAQSLLRRNVAGAPVWLDPLFVLIVTATTHRNKGEKEQAGDES